MDSTEAHGYRRRILVVEDDRTLRTTLAFNLIREGYEVRPRSTARTALGIARGDNGWTSSCSTSCCPA